MRLPSVEDANLVADSNTPGSLYCAVDAEARFLSGLKVPVLDDRLQRVEVANPGLRVLRRDRATRHRPQHTHDRVADLDAPTDPRVLFVRPRTPRDLEVHPEPPRIQLRAV